MSFVPFFKKVTSTAEEIDAGSSTPTLEGVASKSILLDENRDNEKEIELYFHNAADWIHELKKGVAMVTPLRVGPLKRGPALQIVDVAKVSQQPYVLLISSNIKALQLKQH